MSTFRHSPRAPLNIYLNKFLGDSPFMCRAVDVSEEAIYLSRLLEPRFRGREVSLEFALPGTGEILWARGQIVRDGQRRTGEGSAIRFTVLPEAYRRLIQAYVDRHELGLAEAEESRLAA
ncbi:MAG: PilZ domain-containing protein [Deltaproteobacteria bacterium]